MAKWIKNADTVDHTWVGQLVVAGAYYEIQAAEEQAWANDSTLLTDIGSGTAVVAKDDSGTLDITDVNEGINYLKDNLPKDVKLSESASITGIKDPKGMRARLVGIISETVTQNTVAKLDWLCPQLYYNGVAKQSYFDGIQYYAKDAVMGDTATFQVVDKDGTGVTLGLYSQAVYDAYKDGEGVFVVEEFGTGWLMVPNTMEDLMLYKAKVIPGLYIRMIYTSIGTTNDVELVVNLFRHMDAT